MPAFPTSTTVLDSILFRDAFGTPAMREVFSDFSLISRYAEIEIFSNDWWDRPMDEVLQTCIARHRSVV